MQKVFMDISIHPPNSLQLLPVSAPEFIVNEIESLYYIQVNNHFFNAIDL